MIPAEKIRSYHAHVPVMYWPVLWLNLVRLWIFLEACQREGRSGVLTALTRDGRILITHVGESAAERAARNPLGEAFDRTPWTRLCPLGENAFWAALCGGLFHETVTRLSQDSRDTAVTPSQYPARTALNHRPSS